MDILDALKPLLESIPPEEHFHVKRLLQYQLLLLSLMPEPQRYSEYARSELALTHYERYTLEYQRTIDG